MSGLTARASTKRFCSRKFHPPQRGLSPGSNSSMSRASPRSSKAAKAYRPTSFPTKTISHVIHDTRHGVCSPPGTAVAPSPVSPEGSMNPSSRVVVATTGVYRSRAIPAERHRNWGSMWTMGTRHQERTGAARSAPHQDPLRS